MKHPDDLSLSVDIPVPREIPRAKGVHVTHNVKPMRFRIAEVERELIDEAAELCGISSGMFCRWSSYWMAIRIRDLVEKYGGLRQETTRSDNSMSGHDEETVRS